MKKACLVLSFFAVVSLLNISSAQANSGDFDGAVAIGSGYAGIDVAPTNGLIVQGDVGIGTASASQQLVVDGNIDAMSTNGYLTEIANASSTGTTLNKLAKLTGAPSTAVIMATTDADGAIGIVVGGAGTTGNAQIAFGGQASCIFENATTAGDYVTIGLTTAGDCHDAGAARPSSSQAIGHVLTSVSLGSAAPVALSIGGAPSASQWTTSGSNIYYSSGNVGIGTSSPTTTLQVNGTITANAISTSSFVAPTTQQFTSGSGTYTTPTSPRSPLYIRVRMVGGGGGGGGSGTTSTGGTGSSGGASSFGSSFLTANGGAGGTSSFSSTTGGSGGTASIGAGATGQSWTGQQGSDAQMAGGSNGNNITSGGLGGNTALFGGGGATITEAAGITAVANSGGGGSGGGGTTNVNAGNGGGAGGSVDAIIASPSATYSYSVGASGSGGSAGTSGNTGGAGSAGFIAVQEYYQ